jgi:tetratricopeptide (TPR) repeat protein
MHYSIAAIACFLISFLTPYGVDRVKYCWGQYFWMNAAGDPAFLLLTELWSPFSAEMAVHPITSLCYWAFTILTALTFLLNRRKLRVRDIVLYVAFFHLFQSAMRNAVLFALVAIPISARNFGTWMESRVSNGGESKASEEEAHGIRGLQLQLRALFKNHYRHLSQALVCLLAIVLVVDICSGKFYRRERGDFEFGLGVQSGLFPVGTAEQMSKRPESSRLFNDFDFGGYLIWKLYPDWQVFVDNRILVYGDVVRRYSRSRGYPTKFFDLVQEYDMQFALLRHIDSSNALLLKALALHQEWYVLAYDEVSVLFGKGKSAPELNHEWRNEKSESENLWSYSRRLTRFGRLFENINRPTLAEEAYNLAQPDRWQSEGELSGREVYTPAYVNLAELYMSGGQELRALPYLEKAVYWDTRTLEKLYAMKGRWGELHARLGYLYYRAGARDKAKSALRVAIKESPGDESSRKLLNQLR